MKMTKKLVLAAVAVPLVFGSATAFAFGGKGDFKGKGECRGGSDHKILRQLDLTDEQKTQLKEMRTNAKAEFKEMRSEKGQEVMAERQAHQAQVNQLLLADTFDEAAANELAKEMVEKQAERRVKMLERQHQVLSILTPEQKSEIHRNQARTYEQMR